MSKGPTLVGSNKIVARQYINLHISREDVCSYDGECFVDDVLGTNVSDICLSCKYRKVLDMPFLIDEQKRRRNGNH